MANDKRAKSIPHITPACRALISSFACISAGMVACDVTSPRLPKSSVSAASTKGLSNTSSNAGSFLTVIFNP